MKKVWKGAAAAIAALSLGVTGFVGASSAYAADGDVSISVNADDSRTYTAYQIFTGIVKDGKLTDVKWGSDAKLPEGAKVGDSVDRGTLETIEGWSTKTEAQIAAELRKYLKEGATGTAVTKDTDAAVSQGYYLIQQTSTTATGDTKSLDLAKVVGASGLEISPKAGTVTSQKKVKEDDKNYAEGDNKDSRIDYALEAKYNDVADYNIGETVPFEFVGTLPANYDKFDTFKYIFRDSMSSGLTFDAGSVAVYKNSVAEANRIPSDKYTVVTSENDTDPKQLKNGETFLVKWDNLKTVSDLTANDKIIIRYNATLNKSAVIGLPGNPNTMKLEFSNNPNSDSETGTTPEDKVVVLTYELDVHKVDKGDQKDLEDVEFKLWDSNEDSKKAALLTKNDDGTYTFQGWVTENEQTKGTTLTTNANGNIAIKGLDAGTYYLEETKALDGYDLPANPFKIEIIASTNNVQNLFEKDGTVTPLTKMEVKVDDALITDSTIDLTDSKADTTNSAALGIKIENSANSTLPETGGMGTVILYTVGGLIVLIAGVGLAIALRRRQA